MEEIKSSETNLYPVWAIFIFVLILGSPLLEGGETFHTVIWLRLWVLGFALYYFAGRIGREQIEVWAPYANWMLLALWLVVSVSLLVTHYYYITVYWYSNLLVYLLLFYLILNLFAEPAPGKKLARTVFLVLLAAGAMESVLGLGGYLRHPGERSSGSFFNPAFYTGYLLALLSFPLAGLLFDFWPGLSGGKKWLVRAGLGLALILICGGLLVSQSRALVFALVPAGLILLFRFRLRAAAVLVFLVLAVALVPNPFRSRLLSLRQDPYAWDRITIWKGSARMIRHHPLGVGLGMYQFYYDRYQYPLREVKIGRYSKFAQFAHNEYLNFAAECSPVLPLLALAWLGLMLWPLVAIYRKKPEGLEPTDQALLLGFSGSLLGIAANALSDSVLHQPPIMILAIVDLAGTIYLLSHFQPGLLKKVSSPIMHPGFLKIFVFLSGTMIGAIMTFQAAVFGLTYHARTIPGLEQRLNYLARLEHLPSGYASLYLQKALDLKNLFLQTQNPDWVGRALPYYEFAARLNPESYEVFYQWAQAIYQMALYLQNPPLLDKAGEIAQLSLKRSSHYPFTYLMLANIAHLRNNGPREEKWLAAGLEQEPYYFLARELLVDLLLSSGRLDEARTELNLLKAQKREVDAIPRRSLNDFQRTLTKIGEGDIEAREKLLAEKAQ